MRLISTYQSISQNRILKYPLKLIKRVFGISKMFLPKYNPTLKFTLQFIWTYFLLIILSGLYFVYYLKWRYQYFIDRKNKTLHTLNLEKQFRKWLVSYIIQKVLRDQKTVDDVSELLFNLVTKDHDTKEMFARIFCDLLHFKDVINDTRILTKVGIHDYLRSQMCRRQLSEIVVKNVLQDDKEILPTLQRLLSDYLRQDFLVVSNELEKSLINTLWMPGVRKGLNEGINDAAQDSLLDPAVYQMLCDNLIRFFSNELTEFEKQEKIENAETLQQLKE